MIITSVLIGAVAGILCSPLVRRFHRWQVEWSDLVECAVRREQSDQVITGRWLHGLATLSPGRIDFQPRSSLGWRKNGGAPLVISVLSTESNTGRHPSRWQGWRINPKLHIVMLAAETGPIELAVSRHDVHQLVSKVDQTAQ